MISRSTPPSAALIDNAVHHGSRQAWWHWVTTPNAMRPALKMDIPGVLRAQLELWRHLGENPRQPRPVMRQPETYSGYLALSSQ